MRKNNAVYGVFNFVKSFDEAGNVLCEDYHVQTYLIARIHRPVHKGKIGL